MQKSETVITKFDLHNQQLFSYKIPNYVILALNINKVQSINQSIKTHFYSAICRERIRGA